MIGGMVGQTICMERKKFLLLFVQVNEKTFNFLPTLCWWQQAD